MGAPCTQNQCPRAMALYPRLISLPLYPGHDRRSRFSYVADSVKEIAGSAARRRAFAAGSDRDHLGTPWDPY